MNKSAEGSVFTTLAWLGKHILPSAEEIDAMLAEREKGSK